MSRPVPTEQTDCSRAADMARYAWKNAVAAFDLARRLSDEAVEEDPDYDTYFELRILAEDALFKTPAVDSAGALRKLELLFGPEARSAKDEYCPGWTLKWVDPTMADARRFLTGDGE